MKDWNVVVTVYDAPSRYAARRALRAFGYIEQTDYFNVLVLRVADITSFVEDLVALLERDKELQNSIARVLPTQTTFDFTTVEDFEAKAGEAVLPWVGTLAGKSFHVRLNRRGLKGKLSSPEEERFLDDLILARTAELGQPAKIDFTDPDYVIDVETVGTRAGVSLWSRDELKRYPFLRID